MKKLLLFVAALFVAAGAMAQVTCDVYSVGLNPEASGKLYGGLYKNETSQSWFSPSNSNHHVLTSVTKDGQNGLIVTSNYKYNDDLRSGYTYRISNSGSESTVLTASGANDNRYNLVKAISFKNNVYTVGERQPNDYDEYEYNQGYGCIWKNNSVMYYDPDYGYPVEMKGATVSLASPGYYEDQLNVVYYGSNSEWGASGNWTGAVGEFKLNGDFVRTYYLDSINHEPTDILAIDSSLIFIIPVKNHNGLGHSTSMRAGFWWMNGYTGLERYHHLPVSSTVNSAALFVKQEAGMVYIAGIDGYNIKVWRFNAAKASYLQSSDIETVYNISAAGVTLTGMDVNTTGLYLSGYLGNGKIWKDGTVLYDLSNENLGNNYASETYGLAAVENIGNYTVRELPYFENFEMGNTDWYNCKSENSTQTSQKWRRYNDEYSNDKSCIRHGFSNVSQTSNFYTSMVQLPSNPNLTITLKFKSMIDFESTMSSSNYARVYVAEVNNTTEFDDFDYTKIKDFIHDESDPEALGEWKEYEFDLSEFRGKVISINFDYGNQTNAHAWYVTDISITTNEGVGEEGESTALSVMPNPANDVIRVNGLNGMEEVCVYNTLGQVVKTARLNNGESLTISDLSAGVYMLRSENNAKVVKFTVK